jgi:predicted AlkP superfamily phosphohydrolase/phosphomutase
MAARRRLLMIGLDAAEPSLVERWIADGTLPHLAALRARGAYGRLGSTASQLVGSPWPSFYTGTPPSAHGFYHYLIWRPERMAMERPGPDWLPLEPFWRDLARGGVRPVVIDVPLTYAPEPYDGVEILGWATHELLVPSMTHPPGLAAWIRENFGAPPYQDESSSLLSARTMRRTRDELVQSTERVAALAEALSARERWDLFAVALSATHRGGHQLWGPSSLAGEPDAAVRKELSSALVDVYRACDAAVGRIVRAAGDDATVLVFSLHGMGPNPCRTDLLPEMLSRVLAGGPPASAGRPGLAKRLRAAVPERWRHEVKRRLPFALQDRLTAFWRMGRVDWSRTRAASQMADLQGYVRINLRGREAAGIVEPGAEYDALCGSIAAGLASFADADTGRPVVDEIVRSDAVFPPGPRLRDLPDLIVCWAPTPTADERRLVSPRYGSIERTTPGKNPDGRSGNHRPEGFLVAAGGGVGAGGEIRGARILDLAPTAYALFGVPVPPAMQGRPIAALL